MAYDISLALRVKKIITNSDIVEKKMFGGTGFLLNGNMACGVHENNLIVRVGKDRYQDALAHPMAKKFDLTGTAMTGWVEVLPAGTEDDKELAYWVELGLAFARTLPAKNL